MIHCGSCATLRDCYDDTVVLTAAIRGCLTQSEVAFVSLN